MTQSICHKNQVKPGNQETTQKSKKKKKNERKKRRKNVINLLSIWECRSLTMNCSLLMDMFLSALLVNLLHRKLVVISRNPVTPACVVGERKLDSVK